MQLSRSLCLCMCKKHCTAGTDSNRLTAKGKTAGSGNRFRTGGRKEVAFKGIFLPIYSIVFILFPFYIRVGLNGLFRSDNFTGCKGRNL